MKRLYLTVEGQTEQAFATDVLQPHLSPFNVMVVKPRLTGLHARRKGRIPTGGLLNTFAHSLGDIRRWMQEDLSAEARFSMMVDFFSLPTDFPGYDDAMKLADPHEQVMELERALGEEMGDPRFIPYLQVHEFEAIVLANVDCFVVWFDGIDAKLAGLKKECEPFATPEKINHGAQTHPKARIKKYVEDYDENVDGPVLAAEIGIDAIKKKCPHFAQWMNTLEQLDREHG